MRSRRVRYRYYVGICTVYFEICRIRIHADGVLGDTRVIPAVRNARRRYRQTVGSVAQIARDYTGLRHRQLFALQVPRYPQRFVPFRH